MLERISIQNVRPHSMFTKILDGIHLDDLPSLFDINNYNNLVIDVTKDNVVISNYFKLRAMKDNHKRSINIKRYKIVDKQEITKRVLLSILNDFKTNIGENVPNLIICRIMSELYIHERLHASKKREYISEAKLLSKVYANIEPYIELSFSTLSKSIRINKCIKFLKSNMRLKEADVLIQSLKISIDFTFKLIQRFKIFEDMAYQNNDIHPNSSTQHSYAQFEWIPITKSYDGKIVLQRDKIHLPLSLSNCKNNKPGNFTLISPFIHFTPIELLENKVINKLQPSIQQMRGYNFILFLDHIDDDLINNLTFFPSNIWFALTVKNNGDLWYAEKMFPKIEGRNRILVISPDNSDDLNHKVVSNNRICDWIVIEPINNQYNINNESIVNIIEYANKAKIPFYVKPGLSLKMPINKNTYPDTDCDPIGFTAFKPGDNISEILSKMLDNTFSVEEEITLNR